MKHWIARAGSLIAIVVVTGGCNSPKKDQPNDAPKPVPSGSEWSSGGPLVGFTPAVASSSPRVPTSAQSDFTDVPIRIEECDAYVEKMTSCYVPSLDEELRPGALFRVKQLRFTWKRAAEAAKDDPKARKALSAKCEKMMVKEKDKLKKAGCLK